MQSTKYPTCWGFYKMFSTVFFRIGYYWWAGECIFKAIAKQFTILLNTVLEEKHQIHYLPTLPFNHTICVPVYLFKSFFSHLLWSLCHFLYTFIQHVYFIYLGVFCVIRLFMFSMTRVGECICCRSCFFSPFHLSQT